MSSNTIVLLVIVLFDEGQDLKHKSLTIKLLYIPYWFAGVLDYPTAQGCGGAEPIAVLGVIATSNLSMLHIFFTSFYFLLSGAVISNRTFKDTVQV